MQLLMRRGPAPPKGSGLHRYVVVVYKQKSMITVNSIADTDRAKFDVYRFAKLNMLEEVPVGTTFFYSQF
jgi:phosphatidylethanolamine-binding protein